MVRDPRATNDCVDPALVCPAANEEWDESLQQCVFTLPPVVIVGTKPKPKPTTGGGSPAPPATQQAGMFGANGSWLLGGAALGAVILSILKTRGVFDS